MKKKNLLITGCTGLLGSELLRVILLNLDCNVTLLIRAKSDHSAIRRFKQTKELLFCGGSVPPSIDSRLRILCGDIVQNNFGMPKRKYESLVGSIDVVYHCAALTNFNSNLDSVRGVNLRGTDHMLKFCNKSTRLRQLNYISSVFIAGKYEGSYCEKDFFEPQSFNNSYEQSKYEAESLIRGISDPDYSVCIYRPSVLVKSVSEIPISYNGMIHQLFKLLKTEKFTTLPIGKEVVINVLPVQLAAKMIYLLANEKNKQRIFHIINKYNYNLRDFTKQISRYLDCRIPEFVDDHEFNYESLTATEEILLKPFLPYFNLKVKFSAPDTWRGLTKANIRYPKLSYEFIQELVKNNL